jgi:deazaflavin-dependent oxidoreductase (nitroreductase family)
LATALDEFTSALVEHLDDEEAHVVPLISAHISAVEWTRFGYEAFEKFTNDEKLIATGVLEDVATPVEAAWFTGDLPLPIKLMWRFAGRRRYARYIARVRGTGGPGPVLRSLARYANRLAVWLYRRSGGRIGGSAKGIPVLLITVPGRRTGTPHTVPVAYLDHDGGYVVTGSSGGSRTEPQWFRNIRAARQVHIQVGDQHHDVGARVPDGAERDRLWRDVVLNRAPFFAKYEQKAGRVIPIAVIALRPSAHDGS